MRVMSQVRPESKRPLCAIQLKSEAGMNIIKNEVSRLSHRLLHKASLPACKM